MVKNERNNKIPALIMLWFLIDAVVALAPPLYWMVNDNRMTQILGMPASLAYFITVAVCITLSLVAAYFVEEKRGVFQS